MRVMREHFEEITPLCKLPVEKSLIVSWLIVFLLIVVYTGSKLQPEETVARM
jgi:hypothetical protein